MRAQGHGVICNLEGLGSAGRHVPGTSLYATTKAAVRYFTDALILETRGTPLVVGAIRPGMVITDLVLDGLDRESPDWPRAKRIFNILADRVETVAPWIARQVLTNDKTGVRIEWLTRRRAFTRFLLAPFRKRNVFD
jgi:short-subunit dehydrogenase